MNRLNFDNIQQDDLKIRVYSQEEDEIVEFSGIIDMTYPQTFLSPFFKKIHKKTVDLGLKNIFCDFRNLEYINSSGIKCFVEWISWIMELDYNNRYTITFITNEALHWQNVSLKSFTLLAPSHIIIKDKL